MLNSWKNDTGKPGMKSVPNGMNGPAMVDDAPKSHSGGISISVPKAEEPKPIGNSTIDACLTMRGDLESEADIMVKGKVFGNVSCNLLIVDGGAHIEGGIIAKEVVIRGKVDGVIKAEKVRLDKTAVVQSDIYQNTFIAEEGAKILGTLKSLKDAPADIKKKPASGGDAKAAGKTAG